MVNAQAQAKVVGWRSDDGLLEAGGGGVGLVADVEKLKGFGDDLAVYKLVTQLESAISRINGNDNDCEKPL